MCLEPSEWRYGALMMAISSESLPISLDTLISSPFLLNLCQEQAAALLFDNIDQITAALANPPPPPPRSRHNSVSSTSSGTQLPLPPPRPLTPSSRHGSLSGPASASNSTSHSRHNSLSGPVPTSRSSRSDSGGGDRSLNLTRTQTMPVNMLSMQRGDGPFGKGRSWSPISFLKEKKQEMESANIGGVRKLSSWWGKAMENFGMENER
ncbi:hypothetical protein BC936DRAFT_145988 [Jimgerdemannia flammicorona]|uniref:Uncharacterized protein n=1 Tax=Jimgerdemannia flammicorona TaxID=994334 RepID=A0A433DM68_9FUNG|nr:hypothetical protein BC936DRAFT_145988 [Jimgerdemannia flammicorona]